MVSFNTFAYAAFAAVASAQWTNSSSSELPSSSESFIISSSSSSAAESTPYITGYIGEEGSPVFEIVVPGSLGPWTGVEVSGSNDDTAYVFDSVDIAISDETVSAGTTTDDTFAGAYFNAILNEDDLIFLIYATATGGNPYSISATLSVSTADQKLVKRAVTTYDLSFTIEDDASSISSAPVTSTTTEEDISTTVVTITSCSDDKCTETPVTTGVTVVTTTIAGVVTEYTTYCPLSTETVTETAAETTVVTITSCAEDKCTPVVVTTGVTIVTKTEGGVVTEYTTYCPLTTTVTQKPTPTPAPVVYTTKTIVKPAPTSAVVTVTTCEEECHTVPVTTGVTVITKTEGGVPTEYTTYWPLSTTVVVTQPVGPAPTEGKTTVVETTTPAGKTEATVTTKTSTLAAPETEAPKTEAPETTKAPTVETTVVTTPVATAPAATVSTFEGAAANLRTGSALVLGSILLLLF